MKLSTVSAHALSLNGVTQAPHHEYTSFRVNGKIFLTAPPQGDTIHVFVSEEDRERATALFPDWIEKLWWGGKVRGLKIRLAGAPAGPVKALVSRAYEMKALQR